MLEFKYEVYGLRLVSNLEIPGLLPDSNTFSSAATNCGQIHQPAVIEQADVVIEFNSKPDWEISDVASWSDEPLVGIEGGPSLQERKAQTEAGFYTWLHFAGEREWVDFFISPTADSIGISYSNGAPFQNVIALLTGPVLGRVLRTRGETCLHANAVQIGDYAIAVAGTKGAGKSTTTAAFLQAGCRVLADDIVTLRSLDGEFYVFPGHPALRLCPDAAQSIFGSEAALQPVFVDLEDYLDKQCLRLTSNLESSATFANSPLPLAAIYLLEAREKELLALSIESVSPQQALFTLVQHTFANHTLDARQRAHEFAFLGKLVKQVPVRRVRRPDDLQLLPFLVDLIREDAQALGASTVQ